MTLSSFINTTKPRNTSYCPPVSLSSNQKSKRQLESPTHRFPPYQSPTMPFREWATSLKSSRTSSLDPSSRRISETSLSNTDINDSERTLVGTLEVQDLHYYPSGQGRRSLSVVSPTPSHQQQPQVNHQSKDGGCIQRRIDYFVIEDDRYAVRFGNYTGVWAGNAGVSVPQTRSRYFGDHIHQHAYNTNKV